MAVSSQPIRSTEFRIWQARTGLYFVAFNTDGSAQWAKKEDAKVYPSLAAADADQQRLKPSDWPCAIFGW